MANVIQFKKAVKRDARGRVALIGPAGSGKSYTMLKLARQLAGPEGRIAAIDTEHGSLSKYADAFDFDVLEMDSFSPMNFMAALDAAEQGGYAVFCVDSLSHFWVGRDGALEFVDMASKRHRDNMGGWKDFRPHERAMVDRMIASPCHVIVTMRTKNDYVEEQNPTTGKMQRRKVGLAPVQREGLEYEFDLVGYMDEDNTLIIDKTRCPAYTGKAVAKPAEKDFVPFCEWLKGAGPEQQAMQPAREDIPEPVQQLWRRMNSLNGICEVLGGLKNELVEALGEERGAKSYQVLLATHGVDNPNQFKSVQKARQCALQLWMKVQTVRQPKQQEVA
ncbi:MAG TPA: ATP-binding protein [Bryobacteraceae bacterium]|nr:ATP-binding protein [Bryobacteraceae bacterium]